MNLINLYSDYYIDSELVYCVLQHPTRQTRKLISDAKENDNHLDFSGGKATKSIILMNNGKVISCCLNAKTIAGYIQKKQQNV